MAEIETVAIDRDGHRVIINKSDYSSKQTLWSDRAKTEEKPEIPKAEEPVVETEEPETEKKGLKKKLKK